MSRVGRKPVPIPKGVEAQVEGNRVTVKGPRGSLSRSFPPDIAIALEGDQMVVSRPSDDPKHRALHGLVRSLLNNMVIGVSQGFEKSLEISGLGYRAQKTGEKLVLQVGYSHKVEFSPPQGVNLQVEGPTRIRVQGTDKEKVGLAAAQLRAIRPPDPYKGKGIRYSDERLRLKPGKAGKAAKEK